jgi:hypothetical protein
MTEQRRFTLAELLVITTTTAATFGIARLLGLTPVSQIVCACGGLGAFAMLIWKRPFD